MLKTALVGTAIIGVLISLTLGALLIIPWQVSGAFVTASVGIPSLILAYLSSKEKRSTDEPKRASPPTTTGFAQSAELRLKPQIVLEETTVLYADDYVSYDFDLKKGEELVGNISSDEMINFYFLSRHGLNKFENDENFSYEYGSEGILKRKVDFKPPRAGTWYLVIENEEESSKATVTVHLLVKPVKFDAS